MLPKVRKNNDSQVFYTDLIILNKVQSFVIKEFFYYLFLHYNKFTHNTGCYIKLVHNRESNNLAL